MVKKVFFLLKSFVWDVVFPRYCVSCKMEGDWLCSGCLKEIDFIKQPFCSECRRETILGEFCENCKSSYFLDGIFICANFGEGVLKDLIHEFKYNFISDIGSILGKIMISKLNFLDLRSNNLNFDCIIPVPLHEKRKKWRGFNQSEILSKFISDKTNIKIKKDILIRGKYTVPQMELDRKGRLVNLKDVFEFVGVGIVSNQKEQPLRGENILLVDDITTTGATLEECAKVLKRYGAKSVWGIVLAKGK